MRAPTAWPTARSTRRGFLVSAIAGALLLTTGYEAPADTGRPGTARSGDGRAWVGTWSAAMTTVPESDDTAFEDQTLRQIVRTGIGGDTLRVRLSNEFGEQPLVIGEARVARQSEDGPGSRIEPRTDRKLTFGGRSSVTVPAGAPLLSDPVDLRLPEAADLVVSIHLPERTPATTVNAFAAQTNYVADGNVTGRTDLADATTTDRWNFLSGVSVRTSDRSSAVVALGDSITAGTAPDANNRWSDHLARRLAESRSGGRHGSGDRGVLNKGISGNRLLFDPNPPAGHEAEAYAALFGESALRRFDRDVLAQPGARHVVVLLGVNDLGHPGTSAPESERVSARDVITGHQQLIARAHERGLKIYGGTITPFKHDTLGFHSPENEAARQAVNHWIRTSGAYDGVVDFDKALRDPEDPERLRPAYDSGDHLHPNDAGNKAMAEAIPLRFFR
ncbi:SGNH/GDSL hydrolase family protein [Streptomyces sp. Ru87]|uniref:SGNH/GDSL hydrolase family protein n=1 Tax=Streptomyces sp. Ru87 TaxID=2044307 RepID=UPI000BF87AD8|nr:SGNH/GDSL hydrolase family protein [Streptomyces sp. Ru87]PGH49442.1 GDSL family lipase [Streptomyces sp. Ru87]